MTKGNGGTTIVAIVSVLSVGVAGYFVYKGIKSNKDANKGGLKDKDKEPTTPQQLLLQLQHQTIGKEIQHFGGN
jgi:uncharacterized protein HemX